MKRYITAFVIVTVTALIFVASVQAQKTRAAAADTSAMQQPLYTDFRGARLGMTPEEVRVKLGTPVLKDAEMDYYVLSDTVSAQVVYDAAHKARMISVDYANGAGAPDYRAVVGQELITKPDGSAYAMVRYESQSFWVSYSRTAGSVVVVTITIQKI
jgi:outer membrane protein assembly factor BamE (lipoprotein component of BamABCDE complex)